MIAALGLQNDARETNTEAWEAEGENTEHDGHILRGNIVQVLREEGCPEPALGKGRRAV